MCAREHTMQRNDIDMLLMIQKLKKHIVRAESSACRHLLILLLILFRYFADRKTFSSHLVIN